jgi:hypothetical protein
MKKINEKFIAGMLAMLIIALVFGMAFAGCDTGTSSGGSSSGGGGLKAAHMNSTILGTTSVKVTIEAKCVTGATNATIIPTGSHWTVTTATATTVAAITLGKFLLTTTAADVDECPGGESSTPAAGSLNAGDNTVITFAGST